MLYSCANIVPPEGGKKDETAPVLLSIAPADSSLNLKPSKIVLHFNEYVEVKDLEKNMQLSPLLPFPPTVMSYGKRVEIKIQDTLLQANTTYGIALGDAIVDNHEGNPLKNFTYLFSTGAYFDSLELHGRVFDAATGLPDTAALITLYTADENDTAVVRKKPMYAVKADPSGNFTFRSLPDKAFRLYAVQDANNNYLYDFGEEKIGFLNATVRPGIGKDSLYSIYAFQEVKDTTIVDTAAVKDTTAKQEPGGKPSMGIDAKNDKVASRPSKNKLGYTVHADTSNISLRTIELTQALTIDISASLKSLDTPKVYLSYENDGIEIEAIRKLIVDSGKIKITTQWQPDKVYTLRLIKGWAKDTSGAELFPGKYRFRTKREEDYGNIKIHIPKQYFGNDFVLSVYKGADSIYQRPITDSIISLPLLQPGDYGMRIIVDANHNGKWDPGDLFKRIQPEKVIPYSTPIAVKAGWDNEVDFVPADISKGLQSGKDKPQMGAQPVKEPPDKK